MRKITALTTSKNEGTSNVFFALCKCQGEATPTDIARLSNIKNSSVREQLRRLLNFNLAHLPVEEGRFAYYKINWGGFLNLFLEIIKEDSDLFHSTYCPLMEEKTEKQIAENIIDRLKNDLKFNELIKYYALQLCVKDSTMPETIYDLVHSFEDDIQSHKKELKKIKPLQEWIQILENHNNATKKPFKIALKQSKIWG